MANCIRCGRELHGFVFGRKVCDWCKQHEAAQRGEESNVQPVIVSPWKRSEAMPMIVTQAIFGLCIAVFIGMTLSGASPMSPDGEKMVNWGANWSVATLTGQPWRLLTSCFLHFGIIHLAFNMWCLWSLGELVERLYGHFTFACVYLLCGVAGSMASVWWHAAPVVSAGASGAIFGIAGAAIASLKLGEFNNGGMAHGVMRSLIAFVGYNVVFGLVIGTIDNACHIGGLLAGLLLGALIAKLAPLPRLLPRLMIFGLVILVLGAGWWQLERTRGAFYRMVLHSSPEGSTLRVPMPVPDYVQSSIRS